MKPSRRRPGDIDRLVERIVTSAVGPIGAYEIVSEAELQGSHVKPSQVYRCLYRLMKRNQVEKVASLRAFVPASKDHKLCLICVQCGTAEMVAAGEIESELKRCTDDSFFKPLQVHLEARGVCADCGKSEGAKQSKQQR